MTLTVRILGPTAIERSDVPVALGGPKVRLLLAVLTADRSRVVSVDRLCDALWGDDQPGSPVTTLQSHVSRVRRMLEPGATVVARSSGYMLSCPAQSVDADRFEAQAALAESIEDPESLAAHLDGALSLWRGSAFEEFADHEAIVAEAVRLEELRLAVTERWMAARLDREHDPTVVGDLERLVVSSPLRERFWCQLMTALYRTGRHAEALRRASELRTMMRDEFGLDVSAAAKDLEARILAEDPTLARRPVAPVSSRPTLRTVEAGEPSRLIGRDLDVQQIEKLVHDSRLVSLVGPGGVGKTRLARRVGASVDSFTDVFTDDAVLVDLAALRDPAAVPDAVANALDVQRRQHRSLEDTLVDVLRDRSQLVVLDNCEHVLDEVCMLLDRLRRDCPSLHFLTTSRQPLGLQAEVVFTVEPLGVASNEVGAEALVDASPALQLFLERAVVARPGFAATAADLPKLAELCRRLDGLPLALELAAARLRSVGPEVMLERLDQRFRLLDAGPRRGDERHRTLGDLVGWSFELLTPAEQAVFTRLSTFAGGFELRAAEAVCSDEDDTLEVILALVDKSMIQVVDPDEPRYQLLETLREFGYARLEAAGDAERLRDAHLRWFVRVAEHAAVGLTGPDEGSFSRRIDRDFDNLRAAHAHAVRTGDFDSALRIVASLREFAFRRIRYELTTWAATTVEMPHASSHPRYPVVLAVVAYGHFVRGDLEAAVAVGLDARRAGETLATSTSGLAERALANALFYLGRIDDAGRWMDEMLDSARSDGSAARLAHALYMHSVADTSVGRSVRGAALAGEAQAAANSSGSPTAKAQAGYALGLVLEATDPAESAALLRAAADTAAATGNRWIEAFALTEVWWLEARLGDARAALAGSADVIQSWYRGGDWANQWLSLRHVLGILHQLGDHRAAATLHGALTASGAAYALPFEPADAERLDAVVVDLRGELGPHEFASAVREGAAMPDPTLVAFVLDRIKMLTGANDRS